MPTVLIESGSGTWLCPLGVSRVVVTCWGGGGGGGGANGGGNNDGKGVGGGGGGMSQGILNVVAGTSYNYTVGAGGAGGAYDPDPNGDGFGEPGEETTFYGPGGRTIRAYGGGTEFASQGAEPFLAYYCPITCGGGDGDTVGPSSGGGSSGSTVRDSSRRGAITDATAATPCVVTSAAHGLGGGSIVRIREVGGLSGINDQIFTILVPNANQFTLENSGATGTYTSGGQWELVDYRRSNGRDGFATNNRRGLGGYVPPRTGGSGGDGATDEVTARNATWGGGGGGGYNSEASDPIGMAVRNGGDGGDGRVMIEFEVSPVDVTTKHTGSGSRFAPPGTQYTQVSAVAGGGGGATVVAGLGPLGLARLQTQITEKPAPSTIRGPVVYTLADGYIASLGDGVPGSELKLQVNKISGIWKARFLNSANSPVTDYFAANENQPLAEPIAGNSSITILHEDAMVFLAPFDVLNGIVECDIESPTATVGGGGGGGEMMFLTYFTDSRSMAGRSGELTSVGYSVGAGGDARNVEDPGINYGADTDVSFIGAVAGTPFQYDWSVVGGRFGTGSAGGLGGTSTRPYSYAYAGGNGGAPSSIAGTGGGGGGGGGGAFDVYSHDAAASDGGLTNFLTSPQPEGEFVQRSLFVDVPRTKANGATPGLTGGAAQSAVAFGGGGAGGIATDGRAAGTDGAGGVVFITFSRSVAAARSGRTGFRRRQ